MTTSPAADAATTSLTTPGTASVQEPLWAARAADWVELQEPPMRAAFTAGLDAVGVGPGTRHLDVGCGSGLALRISADRGADVAGLDATEALLAFARRRVPGAPMTHGELQSLPHADASFDVVTGFNAFQYAADPVAALADARRVTVPGGRVLALVWGPADQCESAPTFPAFGSLLPPPPPGAPGPFALSEGDALAGLLGRAGLDVEHVEDVPVTWEFPDEDTLMRGQLSSGPAARAINAAGEARTREVVLAALQGCRRDDGSYAYTNVFRIAVGRRAA